MEAPLPAVALDHVGIAVESVAGSPLGRSLGGLSAELDADAERCRPSPEFGPGEQIELVEASRPGSPIERFLERRGPGLHHVAFRVDEALGDVLERLREDGIEPVGEIEPASDGRPSVFLHPSSTGGVLVELVEGPRPQ